MEGQDGRRLAKNISRASPRGVADAPRTGSAASGPSWPPRPSTAYGTITATSADGALAPPPFTARTRTKCTCPVAPKR